MNKPESIELTFTRGTVRITPRGSGPGIDIKVDLIDGTSCVFKVIDARSHGAAAVEIANSFSIDPQEARDFGRRLNLAIAAFVECADVPERSMKSLLMSALDAFDAAHRADLPANAHVLRARASATITALSAILTQGTGCITRDGWIDAICAMAPLGPCRWSPAIHLEYERAAKRNPHTPSRPR